MVSRKIVRGEERRKGIVNGELWIVNGEEGQGKRAR
jgi:hypothetical protein